MQFGNQRKLHSSGTRYPLLPTQLTSAKKSAHLRSKQGPIWGLPSTDWVHLSTLIISCDNSYCWFIFHQTQCDTWIYVSCSPHNLTGNQRPKPEGKMLFSRPWLLCKGWLRGLLGPGATQGIFAHSGRQLVFWALLNRQAQWKPRGHPWGKQGICSLLLTLLWLINGALWMKRGVNYGIINIHSPSLILLWIFEVFFPFKTHMPSQDWKAPFYELKYCISMHNHNRYDF